MQHSINAEPPSYFKGGIPAELRSMFDEPPILFPEPPDADDDALEQRARLVFPETDLCPDQAYNRAEWKRAVRVVRHGRAGWLLDQQVYRRSAAAARRSF